MKRRLTGVTIALCMAFAWLTAAGPTAASFSCNSGWDHRGSGSCVAILYETPNYNGASGDWFGPNGGALALYVTSTGSLSIPDLKAVGYDVPGPDTQDYVRCDGQLISSYGTWNDCASSIRVSIDCHHAVTFYSDANYGGSIVYSFSASGSVSSMSLSKDNTISSLKITYHSVCATSAGI